MDQSTTVARVALSVLAGFIGWLVALVGAEQLLSLLLPIQFGAPQAAFQDAIENGREFQPQAFHLGLHVVLGTVASLLAGFLTAVVINGHKRLPILMGCLLVLIGVLKAAITWQLVPIWYHIAFTSVLLPATIMGAALHGRARPTPPSPTRLPPDS